MEQRKQFRLKSRNTQRLSIDISTETQNRIHALCEEGGAISSLIRTLVTRAWDELQVKKVERLRRKKELEGG